MKRLLLLLLLLAFSLSGQTTRKLTVCDGGGCPYTTYSACEAAEQGDFVSATEGVFCECAGSLTETSTLTINGATTSAAYPWIFGADAANRHAGVFDTSKCSIETTDANAIQIRDDDAIIQDLVIGVTSTSGDQTGIITEFLSTPSLIKVERVIIQGDGSEDTGADEAGIVMSSGDMFYVTRSTFRLLKRDFFGAIRQNVCGPMHIQYSTFFDNSTAVRNRAGCAAGNEVLLDGNLAKGSTLHDNFFEDAPWGTSDDNFGDDTSGPTGGNNKQSLTNINFVDESAGDLHMAPGGSDGLNEGPTSGCPALDIDNESAPQGTACEVGADEVTAAAPPTVQMQSYTLIF